ncbi:carbohydrate ABC transporter permease [Lederbergia ruris]|uniref:carbohydrate ABC transporter permease n=1 Tax=Lederbergia ruris TaxID=217495 RepID=UPI0039A3F54F
MLTKRSKKGVFVLEAFTILVAVVFLIPFYFVIVNSFKSFKDILTNTAALPTTWFIENYTRAWEIMKYPSAFMNSLIVTVLSILGIILISSMAAYRLVRYPTIVNKIIFTLFIAAMIIPFQSIMIPLMKVANTIGLLNNTWGLIVAYLGFGAPLAIFLFHGFIKSIPKEIEESAIVDGCSAYSVFWLIVLPLLKPIIATVSILNALWIWNDFLLPFLFVNSRQELRTIPLSTYSFFGEYTKQWDLAMAALMLGIVPIILFFFLMQKQIVEGVRVGAVKG